MKSWRIGLVALLLGGGWTGGLWAAGPATQPARTTRPWEGRREPGVPLYFENLIHELNLRGQEHETFVAAVRQRQLKMDAWQRANGPELAAINRDAQRARLTGDTALAARAQAAGQGLALEKRALESRLNRQVLATLTPEQRAKVACYQMFGELLRTRELGGADLTFAQKEKAKAICYRYIKQMQALAPEDDAARRALAQQVLGVIETEVVGKHSQPAETGQGK